MPDLLIHDLAELATPLGSRSLAGDAQGAVHRVRDAAVLCRDGEIVFAGPAAELEREHGPLPDAERVDGRGGTAVPGIEIRSEDLASITRGASLTRGLGRSYGDSSLPAPGETRVAGCVLADRILAFDEDSGLLRAEAGLTIGEVQRLFLPRRWSFPVLPGTQFVTLGGGVAADVHGKNHHVDGTIGRHVERLTLRTADDSIVECSRDRNPDLFHATVGGMGLTGHILEVEVVLKRIPSPWVWAESERVSGIDEFIARCRERVADEAQSLGIGNDEYTLTVRIYGHNAVMGSREPVTAYGAHELGIVADVVAVDEERSRAVLAKARYALLHTDFPGRKCISGNLAIPFSPSDITAGPVYRFNVWHTLQVDDPLAPFPIEMVDV